MLAQWYEPLVLGKNVQVREKCILRWQSIHIRASNNLDPLLHEFWGGSHCNCTPPIDSTREFLEHHWPTSSVTFLRSDCKKVTIIYNYFTSVVSSWIFMDFPMWCCAMIHQRRMYDWSVDGWRHRLAPQGCYSGHRERPTWGHWGSGRQDWWFMMEFIMRWLNDG